MKVDLKKKRALAVAVLLTLSCYGQAWADIVIDEDIIVDAGKVKNIGSGNDNLTIGDANKSMTINVGENAVANITANKLELKAGGTYSKSFNFSGLGITNINAKEFYVESVDLGAAASSLNKSHTLNINQDPAYQKGTVKIKGDILTNIHGPSSCGNININFYGVESYFEGYTTEWGYSNINFKFNNKAKWLQTVNASRISWLSLNNGAMIDFIYDGYNMNWLDRGKFGVISVGTEFKSTDGIIKINFDGSENIDRTLNIQAGWITSTNSNIIYAEKYIGKTNLILNNIGHDNLGAIGTVVAAAKEGNGTFNVIKTEGGLSWDKYELKTQLGTELKNFKVSYPAGPVQDPLYGFGDYTYWVISNVTHETAPTTSVSTLLSTVTAGYDTWRNDTDKFNERMGELRLNGAGNDGVWVRTKGSEFGRHSSNGSYTNKQQTYQLGYDAVTSKDDMQTTYTGVAAEYGKGSLSFDSGTGTMKSMGMGVYQTKMYESGHYLDLVGRFDKYKNDFHVADTQGNAISGKYGNNALSLSAEYGRKNELKHGWYVEPQSEVTLGYMFGNDFTTSNNIRVEQKNMPALIGRLGLNVGREVSDKVNFYVKASVNHDFLGNYDMQMTDMTSGERLGASNRFGSSWFDYGAGLSVKTGKDSYAYFDIERAVGGEYKKNWDWNAGVRWSF